MEVSKAKEDQGKKKPVIKMEKELVSRNKLLEKAKIRNKHLSSLVDSDRKVRFIPNKLEAIEYTVEKLQSTVNQLEENYDVAIAKKII